MLRVLYVIAIGLLFAGFIGFGVATFYKAPASPFADQTPTSISPNPTPAELQQQKIDDAKMTERSQAYTKAQQRYTQNLSLILLVIAAAIICISIFGLGMIEVIGDGITLGGIFLLFSGLITSFGANNDLYRFISVGASLAIVIFLTWWKFVRTPKTPTPPAAL